MIIHYNDNIYVVINDNCRLYKQDVLFFFCIRVITIILSMIYVYTRRQKFDMIKISVLRDNNKNLRILHNNNAE